MKIVVNVCYFGLTPKPNKWGQQMGSGDAFQQFVPKRKVETTDFEEVCAKLLLIQKVTANSAI